MKLPWHRHRSSSRGQALVEFAAILPILALLMVMSLDFGRVFFGWVGLQNVVRIAANNAAANPEAFSAPYGSLTPSQRLQYDQYVDQIVREATGLNCAPLPQASPAPTNIPAPSFDDFNGSGATDLGDFASVSMTCQFGLITPLANSVLGGGVTIGAKAEFPVRGAAVANLPTPAPSAGSSSAPTPSPSLGVCGPPVAAAEASPTLGKHPLTVTFTDLSFLNGCSVIGRVWKFGDGGQSLGGPTVTHRYNQRGTYEVTLTVTTSGGSDSTLDPIYIEVTN